MFWVMVEGIAADDAFHRGTKYLREALWIEQVPFGKRVYRL